MRDTLHRHIASPAAVPFVVAGLRLAIGRGLIATGNLVDLYTAITGIGYLISRYASTYRTRGRDVLCGS